MTTPIEIRPVMAKVLALASVVSKRESLPIERVVDLAFQLAQKTMKTPLWNREVDSGLHASMLKSSFKVMQGEFGLTYTSTSIPEKFQKEEDGTYLLKEKESAALGIKTLLKGPLNTDCGGATKILMLHAISEVLGDEKFDLVLSHPETRLRLSKGAVRTLNSLDFFTLPAHVHFHSDDRSHLTLGTCLYFQGIPWYGIKHPAGHGNGFWALYVDRTTLKVPLYFALGFSKLVTEEEIIAKLVELYNEPPSEKSIEIKRSFSKEDFFEFLLKSDGHKTKLKGYTAEIDQCYDSPSSLISLREAKALGAGFFGYAQTYKIASAALACLQNNTLPSIQDPSALAIFHMSQHIRQLAECPEDPSISKITHQALHFIKWAS